MDSFSPSKRSEIMSRIRSRDTSPELMVRRLVHAMGYRYRLHAPDLPGKPDLVFPRLGKVIEVRGCFWHQHQGCVDASLPKTRMAYWIPKLQRNVARDTRNAKQLRAAGWRLLIVWACRTEGRKAEALAARIRKFLERP